MLIEHIRQRLHELDATAQRRRRRTALTPCQPAQDWQGQGELLGFCSNDYLGLANHPDLIRALAEGAQRWGVGSGASHLVSGHSAAHASVEALLARWFEPHIPDAQALLFSSGYSANLALMSALANEHTTLLLDKLNHASLIDGAWLAQAKSRARWQRYPHGRLDALERLLAACESPIKLIVTDAVFSMDGDIADLPALLRLAERHDAYLVVDDAHGLGVLGPQGHGSLAHFGLRSARLIYMGTLGKAVGVGGAFVAAPSLVVEWLLQTARPYIYTTAMPPALAHALEVALRLTEGEEGQRRRLHVQGLLAQWRRGLDAIEWGRPAPRPVPSSTPIQPLIVGDNAQALAWQAALQAQGCYVGAIRPPTVPPGTARLRVTFSAAHGPGDVQRLLGALQQASHTLSAESASA